MTADDQGLYEEFQWLAGNWRRVNPTMAERVALAAGQAGLDHRDLRRGHPKQRCA